MVGAPRVHPHKHCADLLRVLGVDAGIDSLNWEGREAIFLTWCSRRLHDPHPRHLTA
jgi:hypothetical protein